jgi:hypothetical protein
MIQKPDPKCEIQMTTKFILQMTDLTYGLNTKFK